MWGPGSVPAGYVYPILRIGEIGDQAMRTTEDGNWLSESLVEYPKLKELCEKYHKVYIIPSKPQQPPGRAGSHTAAARARKKAAKAEAEIKARELAAAAKPLTDEQRDQQWANQLWLGGVGTAVSLYVAFMPYAAYAHYPTRRSECPRLPACCNRRVSACDHILLLV